MSELCDWITGKEGPCFLTVDNVVALIDSYLFDTPPGDPWTFVPTVLQATGVVDYYLGFNGDLSTGCELCINPNMVIMGEVLYELTTEDILYRDDSYEEVKGDDRVWKKKKEFTLSGRTPRFRDVTIRITHTDKETVGGSGVWSGTQIRKNGVKVCEFTVIDQWREHVCTVNGCNDGDTIELWGYNGLNTIVTVRDFRIMGIAPQVPESGIPGFTATITG